MKARVGRKRYRVAVNRRSDDGSLQMGVPVGPWEETRFQARKRIARLRRAGAALPNLCTSDFAAFPPGVPFLMFGQAINPRRGSRAAK